MKKLLSLSLFFLLFSCVTKKQYTAKVLEINILKKQLDSIYSNGLVDNDGDGIIDKIDSCPSIKGELTANGCPDTDNDGIADLNDKCPTILGPKENEGCPWQDSDGDFVLDKYDECPTIIGSKENKGCPEVSSTYEMPAYKAYFQKLKPTKSIILNEYFKKGTLLRECNNKLTTILKEKLKITEGNYKYFSINENSYAIITKKECINRDGTAINKQNCIPEDSCNMFQFFCVEEGYSRFYLILVTTKTLGTPLDFNEEEFKKVYESHELDTNWNAIDEIKRLFNTNKKLTDDYSIVIKLFEIKKEGPMGEPELLVDPTYDFDKQIKNIFKTPAQ